MMSKTIIGQLLNKYALIDAADAVETDAEHTEVETVNAVESDVEHTETEAVDTLNSDDAEADAEVAHDADLEDLDDEDSFIDEEIEALDQEISALNAEIEHTNTEEQKGALESKRDALIENRYKRQRAYDKKVDNPSYQAAKEKADKYNDKEGEELYTVQVDRRRKGKYVAKKKDPKRSRIAKRAAVGRKKPTRR
ncbi:hypothetical protein [Pseudoalteromonas umbrosa]|uniref:hypothetical protein n=1 Tax=Pseudoalteromonas umbrosa TaxID=3048489 RepID=UPI0024C37EAC|nr:hypothetical protein [Pseudoalteromonas sp. B95]MDK1290244.1 hypothetical protein [Pseudoalteromonas sp. B95]